MSVFNVELKKVVDDSYDIEMGYHLEDQLVEDLETGLLGKIRKFAVITDSNVLDLYAKPISEKLSKAGFKVELFVFPAGEKSKTRQTKAKIEDAMLEKGFRRDCAVIAIGGGVVTDLAGFLAGTYGRGVPFINYATTLLAAADASVGGKTAVDTPLATNLIGLSISLARSTLISPHGKPFRNVRWQAAWQRPSSMHVWRAVKCLSLSRKTWMIL